MRIAAAFSTALDTPDHVQMAEDLGYVRAWLYDTPQQSPDVWMVLALAAQCTTNIGLGPGVLVPSLRHPMVNASGAAALASLAPGRAAIAFGTGYSGRRAMGEPKPIPWAHMRRYITAFRGLLRGETVEWDGATMRMLHPPQAADLPVDLPIYIGALGPKGIEVAHELGDGLFVSSAVPADAKEFAEVAMLVSGTVLDEGEDSTDPRVRASAGPWVAQTFHAMYEFGGSDAVKSLPGGDAWLEVVARTPEAERHLAVHHRHTYDLNEADAAAWDAGAHSLVESVTLSGTVDSVRAKIDAYAQQGVTEIVYQPVGDIRRELKQFLQTTR